MMRELMQSLIARDEPANPNAEMKRIDAIDLLRGFALLLLVLEAARQYFHGAIYAFDPIDVTRTTPAIFATRWVTFICAPCLAMLAGACAYLRGLGEPSKAKRSRYLAIRGAWLVALEVTLVTFGRDFAIAPPLMFAALGALGCALIALAVLVWLPRRVVLGLGLAALAVTNLLDYIQAWRFGPLAPLWQLLHEAIFVASNERLIFLADYPLIPWTAMVMIGYGLGPLFVAESRLRDRAFLWLGAGALCLFFALRLTGFYGDPHAWTPRSDLVHSVMAFLMVEKFPPSLHYALVTLGTSMLLLPALARLKGPMAALPRAFGQAPLFTYVAHFYVVHALALATLLVLGRDISLTIDAIGQYAATPSRWLGSGFDLAAVFPAWLVSLAILYPMARGWARARQSWPRSWRAFF